MKNSRKPQVVVVTRPDGSEHEYPSQTKAGEIEQITQSQISLLCRGYCDEIKGYKARFKDAPKSVEQVEPKPEPHSQLDDSDDEGYF
jgi:hypothetical protein